ncbi:hypothetical protein BS50DRAFT_629873 [Corynespora cassiicola Philippines]|uniref:Uncharacterized protein n=1 Tax=Corynespora cassiicola Philippines TaxID=1448308 RepID=A0A2T2P2K3_CORCC|nr:hypothetical protein BS50DRAFT_629873 [Corynespora cassiicola Philippines]
MIDTRLSYRVGYPRLPVLPLETKIWQPFRGWPPLSPKIYRILFEEHVVYNWCDIVKRHAPGTSPAAKRTFLVASDVSVPGQYDAWKAATYRIRNLLIDQNYPEIDIEFIDISAVDGVIPSPVKHDEKDIISAWETFADTLMDAIQNQSWLAVDVVRRKLGEQNPTWKPTVFITATDAAHVEWWESILPALRRKLPDFFDLDLLHGTSILKTQSESESEPSDFDDLPEVFTSMKSYEKILKMGASIGLQGGQTGTLGSLVRLEKDGEHIDLALSSHHVFAQDGAHLRCPSAGHFLPPAHPHALNKELEITSPSDGDHQRLLDRKQKILQRYSNCSAPEVDTYKTCDSLKKDIYVLKAADRAIGHLFSASGFRVTPNQRFTQEQAVKLSRVLEPGVTTPTGQKTAPSLRQEIDGKTLQWGLNWSLARVSPSHQLSRLTPLNTGRATRVPDLLEASQYCSIDPNKSYDVAKIGRTSGWTSGKINNIGSRLNLRVDHISVVPTELKHRYGTVILSYGVVVDERFPEFLEPGDSGSAVLLKDRSKKQATIVGLGFAGNSRTRISYMQPMDLVVKDIEEITGCKVVYPRFVGEEPGTVIQDD